MLVDIEQDVVDDIAVVSLKYHYDILRGVTEEWARGEVPYLLLEEYNYYLGVIKALKELLMYFGEIDEE